MTLHTMQCSVCVGVANAGLLGCVHNYMPTRGRKGPAFKLVVMLCVAQVLGIAMILLRTMACPVNDMTFALLVTLRKRAMAYICALPASHAVSQLAVRAVQRHACSGNQGSELRQASVLFLRPRSWRSGGACHLGAAMRTFLSAQLDRQLGKGCRCCWATSRSRGHHHTRTKPAYKSDLGVLG